MSENKTIHQWCDAIRQEDGHKLSDGSLRTLKMIEDEINKLYANQFKYDFSKQCKCDYSGGETWCCNACGLPITNQTKANQKPKVTEEEIKKESREYETGDTYEDSCLRVGFQDGAKWILNKLSLSPNGETKGAANTLSAETTDHGICKEQNCEDIATIDYNGNEHWVCKYHYKKLNNDFDEDYK